MKVNQEPKGEPEAADFQIRSPPRLNRFLVKRIQTFLFQRRDEKGGGTDFRKGGARNRFNQAR